MPPKGEEIIQGRDAETARRIPAVLTPIQDRATKQAVVGRETSRRIPAVPIPIQDKTTKQAVVGRETSRRIPAVPTPVQDRATRQRVVKGTDLRIRALPPILRDGAIKGKDNVRAACEPLMI